MGVNSQTARGRQIVGGVGPGQEVLWDYQEALSVATDSTEQILSYVVPVSATFRLLMVEVEGTDIADFCVYADGNRVARKHTYFGGSLGHFFDFRLGDNSGLVIVAGQELLVTVTHSRPNPGDFSARWMGVLES